MKIRNNIYKLLCAALIFFTAGCSDFIDINEDPNNPLEPDYGFLLSSIEVDIAGAMGMEVGGLSALTTAYMHQSFQRGITQGDYGVNGQDFEVITAWNILYSRAGMDLEQIIINGPEDGLLHHVGVAQILKAYVFSVLVDLYGDVPYTEAFAGLENTSPVYDLGEDIYPQLFTLLDDGIANINAESIVIASEQDLIFGGNLALWEKFANSLKLKMYNQVRLVQDVSAEVNALINNPEMLLEDEGDDFQLSYGTSTGPDERNPGYVSEYGSVAGAAYYVNPFFFETMAGIDGTLDGGEEYTHSSYGANVIGGEDPRLDYYFYNQLPAGAVDGDAENPCSYCPSMSGTSFLSIHMFSFNLDPNEGGDQGQSQTVLGLYPIGGQFDPAGVGGSAGPDVGFPEVPQRMLTYYQQLYTIAELQLAGVASGGEAAARATLELAMQASFDKVNQIAGGLGLDAIAATDITAYIDAVLADWDDPASEYSQLEHIMTQKWIASYGYGIDSFNDYRRTGFPTLPTGSTDGLSITVQTREYPFAFPFVQSNLDLNSEAPDQKNIAAPDARVFWDL